MGDGLQCFSIEELEQLDEDQLAFLRRALEREVRNNPEIHRILRERFQSTYDRMASQRRPRRARPRRPPTTDPSTSG
jgi:hypothetical protein